MVLTTLFQILTCAIATDRDLVVMTISLFGSRKESLNTRACSFLCRDRCNVHTSFSTLFSSSYLLVHDFDTMCEWGGNDKFDV